MCCDDQNVIQAADLCLGLVKTETIVSLDLATMYLNDSGDPDEATLMAPDPQKKIGFQKASR